MRNRFVTGAILAAPIALAACGPAATPTGNATTPAAATIAAPKYAAGWDVADACTILSKEDVATVLGVFVEHTEVTQVTRMTDASAGFSTCVYTLPDHKQVAFMARLSPDDDNTPEAMQRMRDETAALMGPAEDVPGLGKAAFWLPKLRQIDVFIDGNRYMNLTLPRGDDDGAMKALAVKLAAKAI